MRDTSSFDLCHGVHIKRDIYHSQAYGCLVYIQAGYTGIMLGSRKGAPLVQLNILSHTRWFSLSAFGRRIAWEKR